MPDGKFQIGSLEEGRGLKMTNFEEPSCYRQQASYSLILATDGERTERTECLCNKQDALAGALNNLWMWLLNCQIWEVNWSVVTA